MPLKQQRPRVPAAVVLMMMMMMMIIIIITIIIIIIIMLRVPIELGLTSIIMIYSLIVLRKVMAAHLTCLHSVEFISLSS